MTSSVNPNRASKPTLQQRLTLAWQSLFTTGDLTTLIITAALVLIPALAFNASGWSLEMRVIIPTTILSVIFGFLFARSRYNELFALILSVGYGSLITLLLAAWVTGSTYDVFVRAINWLVDAFSGGINQDEMIFTLLVSFLFWFLGYNAAWHVFRIDRVWRVILPPGVILVANAVFYNQPDALNLYLAAYMFLALLLVARSNLDAREWEWYANGIRIPPALRQQFLRVGAVLAMIALLVAWGAPTSNLQKQLDAFQNFLRSEPLTQLNELASRLFAPIETDGPTSADYFGGETLELGGSISLGDQEVLYVEAPPDRRYYWRSRVYDTYERGRWTPGADVRLTTPNAPFNIITAPDAAREAVFQRFTLGLRSSRLVYTAPQPSLVDLSTRTDLLYTAPEGSPDRTMNISVIRPTRVLSQGDQYTATSLMTVATANQLREASTNYPTWIAEHPQYLRATQNVIGQRTAALADQIVIESNATTPYDKAKAIETWLRQNITYSETIPQPPAGVDVIDWFLFDLRQGYCNYYATAMVVMLRSQGIPARMAAGFAQGTWDAEKNAYVVLENDAHTWVEAYFPGYGWIEFEPTSAQEPVRRDGDQAESAMLPEVMQASATPTFTPIPPTPTPAPTDTQAPDDATNQPQDVTPTPSITPTFTPSPTATPVILPTQPAPTTPEPRDPLSLILAALGMGLLGLLLIVLLVCFFTFIYWWWEWRGMRGLSPITRAYARLERYLGLLGVKFSDEQTPEERRRRIMRDLPGSERPVTAITRLYVGERYGRPEPMDDEQRSDAADQAWRETRGGILRRWLRRLRFWRRDD